MADFGTLTPAQRRALNALLSNRDARSAAAACGIPERTLYRWLRDPKFTRELREAEQTMLESTVRRLQQASEQAVDALQRGLVASEATQNQLRAADIVLNRLLKAREILEIERRMDEIERRMDEISGGKADESTN